MTEDHKIPKYLIFIFLGIVAIIVIGYFQVNKKQGGITTPKVLGTSTSQDISSAPLVKFIPVPQPVTSPLTNPNIAAKNIVLIDGDSKYVLFSQGQHDKVPIASVTKVMTAILVIENNKPDDVVTMTPEDINVIGSHIGFVPGEKIKVSELMKTLLIMSSNEAGLALARSTSGAVPAFVEKMNARAKELGLNDTHYDDPHGLSPNSESSAFDQAVLFSYALNYPQFKEIISTPQAQAVSLDGHVHDLKNSNRLITDEMHFDGIIGGKTGYTNEAGHSLVTAATRNNLTLISVVLNTASPLNTASAAESKKLLEWGFFSFKK